MNTPARRSFDLPVQPSNGAEFVAFARYVALARGSPSEALAYAEAQPGMFGRVVSVLRAAADYGGTTNPDWLALTDYQIMVGNFLGALASVGVFDRVLEGGAMRVPLKSRVVVNSSIAIGSIVGEGAPKPIKMLSLTAADLPLSKAVAIVVLSSEVLRSSAAGTQAFLATELKRGVALATDQYFLDQLKAGTTPIASAGGTDAAAVAADLGALLGALTVTAESKLFLVLNPATAVTVGVLPGASGFAFDLAAGLAGIPIVPSDALAPGEALLLDASRLIANSDALVVDGSQQATLQMDDAPAPGGTLVSLWADNLFALRCERFFAFRAIGTAVASMTGVAWGTVP